MTGFRSYRNNSEDGGSKGEDSSTSFRHGSMDSPFSSKDRFSRSSSTRSGNPIMFSYSAAPRKPPPIEKKLECTLEDLCFGCVKKILISREVLSDNGVMVQEQELLRIKVKPGWKEGTRITFEGVGDEQPGSLPADVIFSISEKRHEMFRRRGNDLVLKLEIPLVKALSGCSLSIPLLGGEKMICSFNDIIYPGYEKIIQDQGMPIAKDHGKRGDLKVIFHVSFPTNLSNEQRSTLSDIVRETIF